MTHRNGDAIKVEMAKKFMKKYGLESQNERMKHSSCSLSSHFKTAFNVLKSFKDSNEFEGIARKFNVHNAYQNWQH